VNQQPNTDHGEHHQAQGQLQYDGAVAEEVVLGNAPAVEEQQRRQEQQEEDRRLEVDRRDDR